LQRASKPGEVDNLLDNTTTKGRHFWRPLSPQLTDSKAGAEGGIRVPTLLRAPAPQADKSWRRSQPTQENWGPLSPAGANHARSWPRPMESVAHCCTKRGGFGRGRASISATVDDDIKHPQRVIKMAHAPIADAAGALDSDGGRQAWRTLQLGASLMRETRSRQTEMAACTIQNSCMRSSTRLPASILTSKRSLPCTRDRRRGAKWSR
jgi:hypothetical protein